MFHDLDGSCGPSIALGRRLSRLRQGSLSPRTGVPDVRRTAATFPNHVGDRALREVALLRPRTRDELELAHGIGPAKAERYGPGLLEVVRAHALTTPGA